MDLGSVVVVGILVFAVYVFLMYQVYTSAKEKYDFDIFGWGILLRGVAGIFIMVFGLALAPTDYGQGLFDSPGSMIIVSVGLGMVLYNTVETFRKTNFLIAIGAFFFQIISVLIITGYIAQFMGGSEKK